MKAFRRASLIWILIPLTLIVWGCGISDDYEASSSLKIVSSTDPVHTYNGNQEWEFGDMEIVVLNLPRLGVEQPVAIRVQEAVVQFFDSTGAERDPIWYPGIDTRVEPDQEATITLMSPISGDVQGAVESVIDTGGDASTVSTWLVQVTLYGFEDGPSGDEDDVTAFSRGVLFINNNAPTPVVTP